MTESMLSLNLQAFNQDLASDSFAPGGGCVSALAGAHGAALGRMVLALTIGKKKYAEFDQENRSVAARIEALHQGLLQCVERDYEGCQKILQAMALPKDTDEQKSARKAAMTQAFRFANEAPVAVCEQTIELLRIMNAQLSKVNANCITDWGCGALQAYSGLEGAAMNALINIGSIGDAAYGEQLKAKLHPMLREGHELLKTIRTAIHGQLG